MGSYCGFILAHLVLKPESSELTWLILWLLVSWALVPGHQKPWHSVCSINAILSSLRKDFNHLWHRSIEKLKKCKCLLIIVHGLLLMVIPLNLLKSQRSLIDSNVFTSLWFHGNTDDGIYSIDCFDSLDFENMAAILKTSTGCPAVREKSGKFQTWQKSGKSQIILLKVREKINIGKSQGKVREFAFSAI